MVVEAAEHAWYVYPSGRASKTLIFDRAEGDVQRMGMVIGVRPDRIAEYKRLHAAVWPQVLAMIARCNIRNYTIFLREPEGLLFAYWEYHGVSFADDSAKMAADPVTRDWWALCGPCQRPLDTRAEGEWWAAMEPVFHVD